MIEVEFIPHSGHSDSSSWDNVPSADQQRHTLKETFWDSLHSPSFREFAETRRSAAFSGLCFNDLRMAIALH
jgi:hypothetical protein